MVSKYWFLQNPHILILFSLLFYVIFVLEGERHKRGTKIRIHPHF